MTRSVASPRSRVTADQPGPTASSIAAPTWTRAERIWPAAAPERQVSGQRRFDSKRDNSRLTAETWSVGILIMGLIRVPLSKNIIDVLMPYVKTCGVDFPLP